MSQRLRKLEANQVQLRTRIEFAERTLNETQAALRGLERAQRDQTRALLEKLEPVVNELAGWAAARRTLGWVAAAFLTIGTALISAWATLKGRG